MFLKIIAYLTNLSHLRDIPGVSVWVGSRRWARLFAWWVFPYMLWGTVTVCLQQATLALSNLGLHLTHDLSNSMWLLLLLPVFLCTLIALFLSIALGAPTTLYSSLFEPSRPHN